MSGGSGATAGEGASPAKRKVMDLEPGEEVEVVEQGGITLATLQATLQATIQNELRTNRAEIKQAVGGVQKEMVERMGGVQKEMVERIATVETEHDMENKMGSLAERVEKLEMKAQQGGLSAQSTTTTEHGDGLGGRRVPALIVGGWNDDTTAGDVLEKAQQALRMLKIDIDYQDMFVPGVRRGFGLIPLRGPRPGETDEGHRQRVQEAITKVRNAKMQTGHVREDTGQPRYMFLAISQPPERRRRAKLAAKVKRCILELGGEHAHLEAEFATGTVWYKGLRVSSAAGPMKEGATEAGPGWIDTKALARGLKILPDKGEHSYRPALTMITWNTGGAGGRKILDTLQMLADDRMLNCSTFAPAVVALQEVICDPGAHMESSKSWTLVMGKTEAEWRGTGIAYTTAHYHHTHAQHLEGATTMILRGGDLSDMGKTCNAHADMGIGVLSVHLPHHATVTRTEHLLSTWGATSALLMGHSLLGGDINESFYDTEIGAMATTSRGESVMQWLAEQGLWLPEQTMDVPTYHPYNLAMRPRRLDYVAVKGMPGSRGQVHQGSRDIIQSDHDAVSLKVDNPLPPKLRTKATWGGRILKSPDQVEAALRKVRRGGPHSMIADVAKEITIPAPQGGEPWSESDFLKQLRREARRAPWGDRRRLWKSVWGTLKQERRAWMARKVQAAALMNWGELRDLGRLRQPPHWEHRLTADPDWRHHLTQHFKGVFATVPKAEVSDAFRGIRARLRSMCKHTRWEPFNLDELNAATAKWGRRKATGVDQVSLEALQAMLQDAVWAERLLYLYNDILYTGKLYCNMGEGVTILLPKETQPDEWGQTRPITLSSATLKWFSQLLLGRSSHHLDPLTTHQWAWKGKQAEELILVLRKVTRVGMDWKLPTWIVKLDVKKAFDSVYQQNMGAMIAYWVGEVGGQPWEAHAWMALLEADVVNLFVGGEKTSIEQTTGVRQGAPDAPVLFAALVGRALQRAHIPPPSGGQKSPECPADSGAFMDDTYIWGHDPEHLQRKLTAMEKKLQEDGLQVHPKKTAILTNSGDKRRFRVGGAWVEPMQDEGSFRLLGTPLAFKHQVSLLVAEMQTRARKAYYAHRKELTAEAPLEPRLKLLLVYVRPAALWGCSAWPPQDTLLKAANTCQLQYVRNVLGAKRRPNELWVDWNQRTLRGARAIMWKMGVERWSGHVLKRIWGLWGHVARQPGLTRSMLEWRGQKWWKAEQARPLGQRHPGRFNPNQDIEKAIGGIGGIDWMDQARDRQWWQVHEADFVAKHNPPWTSGRQLGLGNLAPNKPMGGKGGPGGHKQRGRAARLAITNDLC
ncbi:unnamed protein product [Symbiodinium natans]|uniref:Reverse transcriptase domain-containing protein n=1 Tax=Symbiodinium natans TaxID=878477 RepID=A0A812U1J2_9DINO|nr:unnamed protein product [Symbiodinium natans]